MDIITVR